MAISTRTQKYNYVAAFKQNIAAWKKLTQTLQDQQLTLTARGWQTGGADAIVDADLDGTVDTATNVSPGPTLGMTAAQANADISTFGTALTTFVSPYLTEMARINPNW